MSYIISGLNIQNISEYDPSQQYLQYDIVDFQLITGRSVYPSYTGLGNTGLAFWFNNDLLEDFQTDSNFLVTGWVNKVQLSGNLYQDDPDITKRPYVDFNENYINVNANQFLTGTGFNLSSQTLFLCFNAAPSAANDDSVNLLQIDKELNFSNSGYLKISGEDKLGSAKIWLDDSSYNARCSIYNTPNIITLVQNPSPSSGPANIKIRQNGFEIGQYNNFYSGWMSGFLSLSGNLNSQGVAYYDLFSFSGALSETEINYYEKYLFEKYFTNGGLYFAKQNVPVSEACSPITYTGQSYWTQDIDDLFSLNYGSNASFSAKLSALNFGDGYKTNISRNINSLNASFNLEYDGLTDKQAKALIAFFENTPEAPVKSLYEGYRGVNINLFSPYKQNAELYFLDINHSTPYNNINKVSIAAESLFESNLNYKGMFVELDEKNIRTYSNTLSNFTYNDVVYFESSDFNKRGYYFYTGTDTTSRISPTNNPTGANSYFTKDFYFKTDIDYNITEKIRVITNELNGSTKQYVKDGINYNVLEFDLAFTKRSNKEALAILKFLDDKAGFKTFNYTLPQPYNKTITVYCPEWNHTYNFYNNNNISVKFIEFKGAAILETDFNTKIDFVS